MAKERLKSPRVRLFVALELPRRLRRGIVSWQRAEVEPEPALHAVPEAALHITLAFLGYQRERDVEPIASLLADLRSAAPRLALAPDPVPIGGKSRPRLFALQTRGEGAEQVQAEVERRLVEAGFYEPETRPFWSHVTVARVSRERRGSNRPALLSSRPGSLPEALLSPFDCVRVALYRSILRPRGAEYVSLAEFELPRRDAAKR